jgi:hypothetical protein
MKIPPRTPVWAELSDGLILAALVIGALALCVVLAVAAVSALGGAS